MPWLIYYHEENKTELIFKKDEFSKFRKKEFNVISWMHIQIEEKISYNSSDLKKL